MTEFVSQLYVCISSQALEYYGKHAVVYCDSSTYTVCEGAEPI